MCIRDRSVKFGRRAYLTASSAHSNGAIGFDYLSSSVISLWFKATPSDTSVNVSSSFVSRGKKNTDSSGEKMHFDIRLEQDDL